MLSGGWEAVVLNTDMAHALFHHHSPAGRSKSLKQKGSSSTKRVDRTHVSSATFSRACRSSADDRVADDMCTSPNSQTRAVSICERSTTLPVETGDFKMCGRRLSKPAEVIDYKTCGKYRTRDPPNGILHPEVNAKSILKNFSAASYRRVVLASDVHRETQSDLHDLTPPPGTPHGPADSPHGSVEPPHHFVESPRRSLDSQSEMRHSPSRTYHPLNSGSCKYRMRLNSTPSASKRVTFDDNITFLHHNRHRRHSTPSLTFD